MFPIDRDDKCISYTYVNMQNEPTTVTLKAAIEETQIPEKEMFRINGLMRTGTVKKEEEFLLLEVKKLVLCILITSLL
ncbi:hypothetical protein IMSAGC007_04584 [Lachnospiraceae bacterium]|nr:hypothetical protein IMSAGC007_04584 [Lachnospiraceae bacterium]